MQHVVRCCEWLGASCSILHANGRAEPLSRTMLLQLGVGLEMGWRHTIEVILNSEVKRYEYCRLKRLGEPNQQGYEPIRAFDEKDMIPPKTQSPGRLPVFQLCFFAGDYPQKN